MRTTILTLRERRYGVWLHRDRVGTLHQRGDYTWFVLEEEYLNDPDRAVLGLIFEEDLAARHASALRLPPWFSNLLPEGQLREWIALDRDVSIAREMELLAQVGTDLPGAVRVLQEDEPAGYLDEALATALAVHEPRGEDVWRFSLAGVGLKFSMLQAGDRLSLPAHGEGGDWIVKLPESTYAGVPQNEHAMMTLAERSGLDVPEHRLIELDKLDRLPERVRLGPEHYAYAVRRFDRSADRGLIHIEDFAQIRNKYPDSKYDGSFATVASLAYRGHDVDSLREFARRLAFNVLISNGDAHLKNWSLIYSDRRLPRLSPVYDLVSTEVYRAHLDPPDMGLKFNGGRRFELVTLGAFQRLEDRLSANGADLAGCAMEVTERVAAAWPDVAPLLDELPEIQRFVTESIESRRRSLFGGS
jgi:serine/threonine-protein kinase HipA